MRGLRTNVMLPEGLLGEIDRVAGARRRSAFLAEAAREKLARLRFDRAAARAFGAWKDAAHPDLMTDVDLARYRERLRGTTNRRMRTRIRHG
ncbi:MAG TPA: hypothetical protein VK201_00895 [bacterium]|nr:hypothetical protein [bacterium]